MICSPSLAVPSSFGPCCSGAKSCPSLCNPTDCSTPGFPCPSLSPGVCSNSRPLSRWCYPTISSSVIPFSIFPASGSFPVNQPFPSGGQSTGASASTTVLPKGSQGWFPLGLTGFSLLSKGLSRVVSNPRAWQRQFFMVQVSHPFVCPPPWE